MRAETIQTVWHAKEKDHNDPVMSLDFHPTLPILATAGADSEVKIWRIVEGAGQGFPAKVEYLFAIVGHDKTVNVVRFSPNGECLASASDDAMCFVYHPAPGLTWASVKNDKGLVRTRLMHSSDVYDLAWSPDSRRIITACVDNECPVWDVVKQREITRLRGHSHFVQGVAWDPLSAYVASQSNDRTVRVYRTGDVNGTASANTAAVVAAVEEAALEAKKRGPKSKAALAAAASRPYACVQVLKTRTMTNANGTAEDAPASAGGAGASSEAGAAAAAAAAAAANKHHMFMDDSVCSFFRRLAWSPDGSFLVAPMGHFRAAPGSPALSTTYLFHRSNLALPIAHLPAATSAKPSSGVRVSPVLYKLRPGVPADNGSFSLPYRMIIAVLTLDSVVVYDTQSPHPIAALSRFHLAEMTDVAWSPSGNVLMMSSNDGYCSIVVFDAGELGERLPLEEYPEAIKDRKLDLVFVKAAKKVKPAAPGEAGASASSAGGVAELQTPQKQAGGAARDEEMLDGDASAAAMPDRAQAVSSGALTAGTKRKVALLHLAPLQSDDAVAQAHDAAAATAPAPAPVTVFAAAPAPAPVAAAPAPSMPMVASVATDITRHLNAGFGASAGGFSALASIFSSLGVPAASTAASTTAVVGGSDIDADRSAKRACLA